MRILLVRHGQTTGDVEDRYGGDYNDHLSAEGRKQTERLAEELKDKHIELIISSPLIRARESAEIISGGIIPIKIEDDFRERNQYGILTGRIKSEAHRDYPDLVEKVKDRYATIEGAESYEDFRKRVKAVFDRVVLSSTHTCIAVVWHGGAMRVLFRDILKKGELGKEIGDCAWVELEKEGEEFTILDLRRIEFLF
ncbi:MAG: histidine phosphatase family protein [bacterium]|nr:histidine phosphatase family protein [bacterium]